MSFFTPIHREGSVTSRTTPLDGNAARIGLDPQFVDSVESLMPLDAGVGRIASAAVLANGAERYRAHGLSEQDAEVQAEVLSTTLTHLGYVAVHEAEPLDFYFTTAHESDVVATLPHLLEGQVAESVPVVAGKKVKGAKTELVRVFEPGDEAGLARLDELEEDGSVYGIDAQIALESLAILAHDRPDTLDGSQAAHFLGQLRQDQTHIRLG